MNIQLLFRRFSYISFFVLLISCKSEQKKQDVLVQHNKIILSTKHKPPLNCNTISKTYVPCIKPQVIVDNKFIYKLTNKGLLLFQSQPIKNQKPQKPLNIVVISDTSSKTFIKLLKSIRALSSKYTFKLYVKPIWWRNRKAMDIAIKLFYTANFPSQKANPIDIITLNKPISSIKNNIKTLNYLKNTKTELEQFGINMQISNLIFINGYIVEQDNLSKSFERISKIKLPITKKLQFKTDQKTISKYINNFKNLCKTESSWENKINIIKTCMRTNLKCEKLKECISNKYYELKISNAYKINKNQKFSSVVLTAYLDLGCPFCTMVYSSIKTFLQKHPQIKFKLKIHPISSHPEAKKIAILALLIKQKKGNPAYLDFVDQIFTFNGLIKFNEAKILLKKYNITENEIKNAFKNISLQIELNKNINFRMEAGAEGVPFVGFNNLYFEGLLSDKFLDYAFNKIK